jgi:hypothetical protein
MINDFYVKDGNWGVMESNVFDPFVDWLKANDLVSDSLDADLLFTNKCL